MPEPAIPFFIALLILFAAVTGCTTHRTATPRPGEFAPRLGDEIVVCGRFVHTGAPVVTWMDPGGYDAYRTERRAQSPSARPGPPAREPPAARTAADLGFVATFMRSGRAVQSYAMRGRFTPSAAPRWFQRLKPGRR